jgi:hypothetical protein
VIESVRQGGVRPPGEPEGASGGRLFITCQMRNSNAPSALLAVSFDTGVVLGIPPDILSSLKELTQPSRDRDISVRLRF